MILNPQVEVVVTYGPGAIDITDSGATKALEIIQRSRILRHMSAVELVNEALDRIDPLVCSAGTDAELVFGEMIRRLMKKGPTHEQ